MQRPLNAVAALAAWAVAAFGLPAVGVAADKPSLSVVLERDTVGAGQSVNVRVWVENPTDGLVSNPVLSLKAPRFVQFGVSVPGADGKQDACAIKGDDIYPLESVPPQSLKASAQTFCIKSKAWVDEVDANLVFAIDYVLETPAANSPPRAASARADTAVAEKTLKVGLFGADEVGGVSLRLTSFFLPGALMLLMLGAFRSEWVKRFDTAGQAILAVAVSSLLYFVVSSLQLIQGVSGGVSFLLLATCCVLAIGLGAALALLEKKLADDRARARAALLINSHDSEIVALAKAFEAAKNDPRPVSATMVWGDDRETYIGAAIGTNADGGSVIFGWYRVEADDAARTQEIKDHLDAGRYAEALKTPGARLSDGDYVRLRNAGAPAAPMAAMSVALGSEPKPILSRAKVLDLDVTAKPLTLN